MLDQLRDDHRRILDAADRLEAGLPRDLPADISAVARMRWQLLRDVLQHISAEERFVETLGDATTGETGPAASDFARLLRQHVAQWSLQAPASAWAEFRTALLALLAALRARIAFEEEHLFDQWQSIVSRMHHRTLVRSSSGAPIGRY